MTNSLGGTVSKIDPRIGRVVQTIPVGNGPSGVAFGEGAVWVANSTDRTVTRIDPATGHSRVLPAGAGADGIAVGDGAVWVTSESAGTLTRIDPRAGIVTPPVNVGHGASAVAVGAGARLGRQHAGRHGLAGRPDLERRARDDQGSAPARAGSR